MYGAEAHPITGLANRFKLYGIGFESCKRVLVMGLEDGMATYHILLAQPGLGLVDGRLARLNRLFVDRRPCRRGLVGIRRRSGRGDLAAGRFCQAGRILARGWRSEPGLGVLQELLDLVICEVDNRVCHGGGKTERLRKSCEGEESQIAREKKIMAAESFRREVCGACTLMDPSMLIKTAGGRASHPWNVRGVAEANRAPQLR